MFANVLVNDTDNPGTILPASVRVTVVERNMYSGSIVPIVWIGHSLETEDPYAAVEVEVLHGEAFSDRELFSRNPFGNVFFKFETIEDGLVEARWMSFDFAVENHNSQSIYVRGAIHDVNIPWNLSYTDLKDDQSSFVVLSGIGYSVTEADAIRVEYRAVDGNRLYTVELETTAALKGMIDLPPVPITIAFTIVNKRDLIWDAEILSSEVNVDGDLLADYAVYKGLPPVLNFVPDEDRVSGEIRLAFSNGCGGYLQMGLLFQDIPLEIVG